MASISKRGSSYRITVSCGYDIYGRKLCETTTYRPEPSLSPKKAEKAVQEFAIAFEQRVKSGLLMDGRKLTLKEFSDHWVAEYGRINLQPGTLQNYTAALDDQILPVLGHLKLTEIKPHTVTRFYNNLLQDGVRKDGKPGGYSINSIRKIHNVLSSVLRTAVEWEVLAQNPCQKVKLPSSPSTAESIKFFTPAQTQAFLDYIKGSYTVTVSGHSRIDDTGKNTKLATIRCKGKYRNNFRSFFSWLSTQGCGRGNC